MKKMRTYAGATVVKLTYKAPWSRKLQVSYRVIEFHDIIMKLNKLYDDDKEAWDTYCRVFHHLVIMTAKKDFRSVYDECTIIEAEEMR